MSGFRVRISVSVRVITDWHVVAQSANSDVEVMSHESCFSETLRSVNYHYAHAQ